MGELQYWTEGLLDFSFAGSVSPDPEALLACIQCGSCTASCPTANRMTLSPQQLMRLIRLGMSEEAVASLAYWRCTSCSACSTACPRGIPILDTIIGLKAYALTHGAAPEDVELLRNTLAATHNVSGDDNAARSGWAANVPQLLGEIERREGADVAYFVGCVASLYPRAFAIPQAFARALARGGVSVATLGGDEWCCGYPLYNAGLKREMTYLVEHNIRQIEELGVSVLVTACPSCYYTWKTIYPTIAKLPPRLAIMHSTQLLAELLADGRLAPRPLGRVVTYHDPCDLGRKAGEYEAPRAIIAALPGIELREMANVRANALCCGGGGDVKIFSYDTTIEVARRRAQQAVDVGADTIVSGCQQCKRALLGAVQSMRQPTRVLDLAELVWDALREREE
jgi:heterodisulfide reductase subunit D